LRLRWKKILNTLCSGIIQKAKGRKLKLFGVKIYGDPGKRSAGKDKKSKEYFWAQEN